MACTLETYKLNGVDLGADFGFRPKAPIALSGMWDMPSRLYKTSHNWLSKNYQEPYIREDEVFFGGRTLELKGYITYLSATDLGSDYYNLNAFIDGFSANGGHAELECYFGTFDVVVTSFSIVELCPTGFAEISIIFRENEVSLWGATPSTASSGKGISGYSWQDFGAHTENATGAYNRGLAKELPVSVYGREYTRTIARDGVNVNVSLIFRGASLNEVGSNIGGLVRVLSSEGKKILNLSDGLIRETYSVNGLKSELLRYTSKQVFARVTFSLQEIAISKEMYVFTYNDDTDYLGNNYNEVLSFVVR